MRTFKDNTGKEITLQEIVELISENYEYEVFVGSDSQVHSEQKVIYVTCIVLYKKGKGGRIFTCKDTESHTNSLRERLQKEVWRSLEIAFELRNILPSTVELVVHVDVNTKKNFRSSEYLQEFVGMIMSQGFKCVVKPDAFAAQNCANRGTK